MIKVSNLRHSYEKDGDYAVDDISFEIAKGEIFGFLGPSGAGKTTTQNILVGLIDHQEGVIAIDGERRQGPPDKAFYNRIGVGFEKPTVYKKLSGLDNLAFHAKLYDRETEDPQELLQMVGLREDADKKAGAYSKGMMQRLGFARSMLNKPDIWFLDEPTMGLDPTTANSIKRIIRRKQDEGTTIFLTTHNMFVADELCDRVAFIVDGKIAAMDSPKALKLAQGQQTVTVEYTASNNGGPLQAETFAMDDEGTRRLQEFIGSHAVKTIHSGEPTLEEIFIKMTGRALE